MSSQAPTFIAQREDRGRLLLVGIPFLTGSLVRVVLGVWADQRRNLTF